MAFGVNVFLINHELLDGGTFGMGLILHYLTGLQVGLMFILFSIPIVILAWFSNRLFLYNSLHGMLFSSFAVDISYRSLRDFGVFLNQPPVVSAMLGGLFVGAGIGLMLRFDTSIGGTDLLGQILAKYANLNPGIIILIIDFIIILLGYCLLKGNSLFLSSITVICVGVMTSMLTSKKKKYKGPVILVEHTG